MGFLDQYEPVSDRIARFWEQYPNGRIHTQIVERTEKDIIIRADIYTDREDALAATIDFAHEVIGSSNINKTSWLENCATSAIGRALADLNFQAKKDGATVRPSREEMTKATQPERDWVAEATALARKSDLEAIRTLLVSALSSNAPKAVTEQLKAIGKKLRDTIAPDPENPPF